jgi:radical SAM protein with 4Fe4S-binding SPASM domain
MMELRKLFRQFIFLPGAVDYLSQHLVMDTEHSLWSVIVDISKGCNLTCSMCFFSGSRVEYADDILIEKIKTVVLPHAMDIAFGCRHEAMLHPALPRYLRELHDEKTRIAHPLFLCLLTSGTLLDQKNSLELAGSGMNTILFSIDSADRKCYESVRKPARLPDLLKKLADFMEISRAYSINKAVQSIIMKSTLPHLAFTIETLAAMGFDNFHFNQMVIAPRRTRHEVLRFTHDSADEITRSMAELQTAAKKRAVMLEVPETAPPPMENGIFPLLAEGNIWDEDHLARRRRCVCVAPWFKLRIDHKGYVFPCQLMLNKRTSWGNILADSFENIVNGFTAVQMRRDLLSGTAPNPTCRKCPFGPGTG